MLSSRSTRLAATLLLVLLFGWCVRACRLSTPDTQPATLKAPAGEKTSNAFPDE